MFKQVFGTIALVALVAACTGTPEVQTGDDAEVILGSLHKIDNSKAAMAYIDPNADFSKYTRILLKPLDVDNVEIIQPDTTNSIASRSRNSEWTLTDQDKIKLQEAFRDAMVKQLDAKGGYAIVTEPADDVMQIEASLLGIAPSAPKDDNRSRAIGRTRTYTEGAGSLAVMVVLGDSETREVLALMKDSRASNSYWGSNNSVSNWSDVRTIFNGWASAIRRGMDKFHGK